MSNNVQREQKIINSIFYFETKNTALFYGKMIFFYVVLGVLLYGFGGAAVDILVDNEIHTLPGGLISGWGSVVYAIVASYEMATFAVPLWAQGVIVVLISLLIWLTLQIWKDRGVYITKTQHLLRYWIPKAPQEDSQT